MEHAALGHCAAKKETFYGYRLVLLTTRDGVITHFALLPGDADEREGAMDLLPEAYGLRVLGDKGFIDKEKQEWLREHRAVQLYTPKRKNQQEQNPEGWDALLNRVRRGIETTYAQAKGEFNLERPGARTFWGLCSRLIAKLTGMTIAAWSNVLKGRSPLELAAFSF